jgi:hypothetical protein
VVREGVGVGAGEEMTQALYAHMSNKKIKIKKKVAEESRGLSVHLFSSFNWMHCL